MMFNITTNSSTVEGVVGGQQLHSTPQQPQCFYPSSIEPVSEVTVQYFLQALYWLTSAISVLGNLTVIIVQSCCSRPPSSRSSIRKYLNNLAVADISTALLSMPFTYTNIVLGHWPHAHWLCPAAQYAQLLSVFVTSTTLTIIGIERYIVTLHPLSRSCAWLKSHSSTLLVSFWLVGALYAYIPVSSTTTIAIHVHGIQYWQCTYDERHSNALKLPLFVLINFLLTYLLPLFIMTASYTAIMHKLSCNQNFIAKYSSPSSNRCAWIYVKEQTEVLGACTISPALSIDSRSKTIKIMFTVIILYIICWSPIKLFQFLRHYRIISYCTRQQLQLTLYSYIACHWLAMANSLINPVIYSFMSRGFRNDCTKVCQSIRQQLSYSTLKEFFCPSKAFEHWALSKWFNRNS